MGLRVFIIFKVKLESFQNSCTNLHTKVTYNLQRIYLCPSIHFSWKFKGVCFEAPIAHYLKQLQVTNTFKPWIQKYLWFPCCFYVLAIVYYLLLGLFIFKLFFITTATYIGSNNNARLSPKHSPSHAKLNVTMFKVRFILMFLMLECETGISNERNNKRGNIICIFCVFVFLYYHIRNLYESMYCRCAFNRIWNMILKVLIVILDHFAEFTIYF